jgi:hypothetical protein
MKQGYVMFAAATLMSLVSASPAGAAPPTVTPSPGYDARLQEEHAAQSAVAKPVVPKSRSTRKSGRRHHRVH